MENKKYTDTVELKDKLVIWNLYFNRMFTYDELIEHFKGKYKYSQLKSIIMEKLRDGNSN